MRNLLSMLCGANSAPAGVVHAGYSAANFATTRKLTSTDLIDFAPGKSMVLIIDAGSASSFGTVIGCGNGAYLTARKGWAIQHVGTGFWAVVGGGLNTGEIGYLSQQNRFGIMMIALTWRASDNRVRWSEGGLPVIDTGFAGTPGAALDGTCQSVIGAPFTGDGGAAAHTGGLLGCAIIDRELSDVDLRAATAFGEDSRLRLFSTITSDPDASFIWEASADWDGVSGTSVSRGSSPVTWTVTGAVSRADVSETRIEVTGANVSDSKYAVDRTDYIERGVFATLRATSDITRIGVEHYIKGTGINTGGCAAWADGVYKGAAVAGTVSQVANNPACVDVSLGAGAGKDIEIVAGAQIILTDVEGAYLKAVRYRAGEGTFSPLRTPPSRRVVFLLDSIGEGYGTTTPMQDSQILKLRAAATAGTRISAFGYANASLHILGQASGTVATTIAMCDGTASNDVVIQWGKNDQGQTQAGEESQLTALCNSLEAAGITGLHIWLWSPIQSVAPASETTGANTLTEIRDAMTAVAALNPSGRTVIGGTGVVTSGNLSDGMHPNTAGHVELYNYNLTALSL